MLVGGISDFALTQTTAFNCNRHEDRQRAELAGAAVGGYIRNLKRTVAYSAGPGLGDRLMVGLQTLTLPV